MRLRFPLAASFSKAVMAKTADSPRRLALRCFTGRWADGSAYLTLQLATVSGDAETRRSLVFFWFKPW